MHRLRTLYLVLFACLALGLAGCPDDDDDSSDTTDDDDAGLDDDDATPPDDDDATSDDDDDATPPDDDDVTGDDDDAAGGLSVDADAIDFTHVIGSDPCPPTYQVLGEMTLTNGSAAEATFTVRSSGGGSFNSAVGLWTGTEPHSNELTGTLAAGTSVTLSVVFTCSVDTGLAPKPITATISVNFDNGSQSLEESYPVSGTVQN